VTCWPHKVVLHLLIFGFLAANANAQGAGLLGRRIVDVQYSPAQILAPADLQRVQTLKTGATLREQDVGNAIDSLFATGRFTDIAAEAEPSGDGVIVRFVTTPAYFIGGLAVEGSISGPPNRGEITNTGQLQLGSIFRQEDVDRAVTRIRRLFTSNGLYEAEVTPEIQKSGYAEQVFVTFHVKAGKRAKYEMPVIHGETKLSDGAILRATGWRIPLIHWWRHVTDARTRHGVQGILGKYQKQDRLTARVELEKLDYDAGRRRVRPNLNLEAGPKIRVKAVEAKVSKRVLRRYVPVFQERAVDNDLLVEGARNLRDYFQSKGYYDVDVDFRTRPLANDERVIEYVIAQGQRYKLTKLAITGNRYFSDSDLRERMFMEPATFTMRRGRYSEAFRKKDEENIANLYKSNGFHDVNVTSIVDRSLGGATGQVGVTVQIEEGPQWIVDNITLDGVQEGDREVMESGLASLAGQPFSEVNMATDRSYILTRYYSQGYPEADFKAEWHHSDTPNHVNIRYEIKEGDRKFVRDVITTGLKTTRQDLVAKRMTLSPGEPLSPLEQSAIQRSFYDMGIFARVDTAIENSEGETDNKYILYNFEEANRYTLALGFGAQLARFGSPSSNSLATPGGSTGFSPQASMNLSRLNVLGRGHTVSLRGVYSNLQKRGSISYLAPRFQDVDGRNLTLSLLYDNSLNVRTFSSRRQEAAVQVSQRFSKATTGLFRIAYRRVSVSNVVIPVLLVPQLVQPVRLGIVSANIAQDRRDNSADPHRGIYNTADLGLSARFLGSQRSFTRVLLRNATYHRVTRRTVFARQTQFGIISPFAAPQGLSDQQSVPLPERFFGGGAESLRAFPYNQAGPRDAGEALVLGGPNSQPTGFPLGGNALLFNNLELRFPLLGPNIQGVLFHDMGNVYNTISEVSFRFKQRDLNDFNYMVHAVGFGVRYRTPVGPVRGDLAYSINPPSYLGFGGTADQLLQCNPNRPASELPSFCTATRQNVSHFQFFFSIGQTF
jgi:outer membrane protein insertion porin family